MQIKQEKKKISVKIKEKKKKMKPSGFEPTVASFEGPRINHWDTT